MLKVQEIRELIKLLDQSSVDELKYEENGCKIKLKKNSAKQVVTTEQVSTPSVEVAPAKTSEPSNEEKKQEAPKQETKKEEQPKASSANIDDENLHKIESPMVGTFYAAPSPDEDPYVQVGDKVKADTVVCIVEAMKLFNEIEAEVEGEIVEVLVENGQLVEYGQPLFLVKPE